MILSSADSGEWFQMSGIQEQNGGVARYHFSDRKQNAPVSSEITGYFASMLVALHKQHPGNGYFESALKASKFLVHDAWDEQLSAMPFETEGDGSKFSYFFDNGIIVRGLLSVWRESRSPELLSTAFQCAESMSRDFFDGQDFIPIIELPTKIPLAVDKARWSRSPGCYQLKAALAWYELGQIAKQDCYFDLYKTLLRSSLDAHDSFLPGCDTEIPVMDRLHAYCYFLEGLLPVVNHPECANALAVGIKRTKDFVNAISPQFLRSDVVAQLLRVRLFADAFGVLPLDENAALEEAATLETFQSKDPDQQLKGGFWFGKKQNGMLPFMNPVSTAFCCQALQMWTQYRQGDRRLEWQQLV
jgi:hypothetical protein